MRTIRKDKPEFLTTSSPLLLVSPYQFTGLGMFSSVNPPIGGFCPPKTKSVEIYISFFLLFLHTFTTFCAPSTFILYASPSTPWLYLFRIHPHRSLQQTGSILYDRCHF